MLRIRPDQIVRLEQARSQDFANRVANFLRENVPAMQSAGTAELTKECQPLIEKARSYGLLTEREIMSYVLSAAYLGADFDVSIPIAGATLRNEFASGFEKVRQLERLTLKTLQMIER
jgi:hypothetical protein